MSSSMDSSEDPEEEKHFIALLEDPSNSEVRAAYLAFLESRGDARADLMRAANRLLAGISDDGERRRVLEWVRQVDAPEYSWERLVLSGAIPLFNCGLQAQAPRRVRFAFECPQTWGGLKPTADPKIRFCEGCQLSVVRCDTVSEAEKQARQGACIAVTAALVDKATERRMRLYLGRPEPREIWADELFAREGRVK